MITSQWLEKVPSCLQSHDWTFIMEAILIQMRLDIGMELDELTFSVPDIF